MLQSGLPYGPGKQIALTALTAKRLLVYFLLPCLDSLGCHAQMERLSALQNTVHDRRAVDLRIAPVSGKVAISNACLGSCAVAYQS